MEGKIRSSTEGLDILDALEKKRTQLEQEIADFKAQKENEYREYELSLRNEKINGTKKATIEKDNSQAETTRPRELTDKERKERVNVPDRGCDTESALGELNGEKQIKASDLSLGGCPSSPLHKAHEREKEFQGLFTPGFLPLIDGRTVSEKHRSRETSPPPFSHQDHLAPDTNGNATQFSSSVTEHPVTTLSPHLHHPFSSSAPHEQAERPGRHRRDSSRSDVSSASLRSSLRDPSQPKSPKRVLFSIDNSVVSPSTSPLAQRRNTMPTDKSSKSPNRENLEKLEIVKSRKGKKKKESTSTAKASSRNEAKGSRTNSSANGWSNLLAPLRQPAANKKTPSPLMGGDDFERVESNDEELFTFDEDLDAVRPSRASTSNGIPDLPSDEDEELRRKQPLTGSSPHAGSLPIEIKWPGRRDSEG